MDKKLTAYVKIKDKLEAYNYAMNLINYDAETIAPKKAYIDRGNYIATLYDEYNKIYLSDEFDNVLKGVEENISKYNDEVKRSVKIDRKNYNLNKKVPLEKQSAYMNLTNETTYYWQLAKDKNNYAIYEPYLTKLIDSTLDIASYYGKINGSYYNTYLDMYEEGITTDILDTFFENLKNKLVPLIKRIGESNKVIRDDFLYRKVSKKKQLKVSNYILKTIGFDMNKGVLGETMHPFTSMISNNDTRVTTHIYETNFTSTIFSCAHEGGHGIYEQNCNKKLFGECKNPCSMSIHESQSRLYENIIARSYAFTKMTFPTIQKIVKPALDDVTMDEYYLAINKVTPSLIRTESDEVTYCLHILIRYEIEKMLFNKEITPKDIPSVWDAKYKEYLGVNVTSDVEGCMQDSHWAGAAFGYFFSYALGNAYSGQFAHYLAKDVDLSTMDKNKMKEIKKWLTDHIYKYGNLYAPQELIKHATGEAFNPNYYIDYLVTKYENIYEVK